MILTPIHHVISADDNRLLKQHLGVSGHSLWDFAGIDMIALEQAVEHRLGRKVMDGESLEDAITSIGGDRLSGIIYKMIRGVANYEDQPPFKREAGSNFFSDLDDV